MLADSDALPPLLTSMTGPSIHEMSSGVLTCVSSQTCICKSIKSYWCLNTSQTGSPVFFSKCVCGLVHQKHLSSS